MKLTAFCRDEATISHSAFDSMCHTEMKYFIFVGMALLKRYSL